MKKWLALLLVFIMLLSVLTGCAQKSTTVLEPVMEAPNSIVDAQSDEHGDLILYMTDGTTIAAGHVRGKDGADGVTPTIGENGNWWIGETDTGVKAGQEEFIFEQNGGGKRLLAYVGTASEVTIPEDCVWIGSGAFSNNRVIKIIGL